MGSGRIVALATALLLVPAQAFAAPADVTGSGSGFFVNADGWLITNAHVLEGCASASVPALGTLTDWKIDKQNDLAAARLVGAAPASTITLRHAPPRLGEDVVAFGYPLASMLSESVKVTTGNINSLTGLHDDTRYLQISTPIQPGNSGGPLVDRGGALLGITTAVLALGVMEGTGALAQNVNFAVRGSVLEIFLQSRGVAYSTEDAAASPLATADLADKIAPAVVQVFCHGKTPTVAESAPTSPSPAYEPPAKVSAPVQPSMSDVEAAKDFLHRYHFAWSQPNAAAMAYMSSVYAGSLSFYGKETSAGAVLREKQNFAARWPLRYYWMDDDTLYASCGGSICTASGVVEWFAKSEARGKRSSGKATFEVRIDIARGVIVSETGAVLKGQKPTVEPLLYAWQELNGRCRGGSGDDPKTADACGARDLADAALAAADMCYGRPGEYGYQMDWHRCDVN